MLSYTSLQAGYRGLLAAGLTLSLAGGIWLGSSYVHTERQQTSDTKTESPAGKG